MLDHKWELVQAGKRTIGRARQRINNGVSFKKIPTVTQHRASRGRPPVRLGHHC